MKRILVAVGTRPEAIKMAPVISALFEREDVSPTVLATGQHRELLQQALEMFDLVPDINLDVMMTNQQLSDVTARVLQGATSVLRDLRPEMVLVHGDTTTSMAVGLAAFYLGFPIGHVEAGLRTYNLQAPFPEELNRQITGRLATLHFAPTATARNQLLGEHISEETIWVTGNTVVDALLQTLQRIDRDPVLYKEVSGRLDQALRFDWKREMTILVTGHRRENFDGGIDALCTALRDLALQHPEVHVVYPVHPNPAVVNVVFQRLQGLPNVHLPAPLGYLDFLVMLRLSRFVITDSGGIQEEAPILGKPVLIVRDVTERPEALECGAAKLVGTEARKILSASLELLEDSTAYSTMAVPRYVYGDGNAAARIVEVVANGLPIGTTEWLS